jgi:hypothetical protein
MTYPAPKYLKDDPWFGSTPILSEKQQEYVEMRKALESESLLIPEEENQPRKEVDNIHEVMYDIAIRCGKTTIQLDPVGGSENFHQ